MIFADLDKKATLKKVRLFLDHDFQRLRRFANYEGLMTSPTIDGQPRQHGFTNPDGKFINHTSNRKLLALAIKAMDSCTGDGPTILKDKYINGKLAFETYNEIGVTSSTYSRYLNTALLEFADCLYFLICGLGDELVIDLRVMK